MNIIKRTYDRLTGVLGYDYQGKPLRKGDLVEAIPSQNPPPSCQCQLVVVRKGRKLDAEIYEHIKSPYLVVSNPDDLHIAIGGPEAIRKVTPPEQEARWENVERATGWKPQVREVEHAK